ncbi:hypothetical protein ACP71W_22905 [Klebsiella pneumoniae]
MHSVVCPLQHAGETIVHSGVPYPGGKQQLCRQQGHQLAGAVTGTDPHYRKRDPRQ